MQKNKVAGQPAHPHSLISAFVVHSLEILADKLATRTNSAFLKWIIQTFFHMHLL